MGIDDVLNHFRYDIGSQIARWMVKVVRLSDLAHNQNLNSDRLPSQSIQESAVSMLRL